MTTFVIKELKIPKRDVTGKDKDVYEYSTRSVRVDITNNETQDRGNLSELSLVQTTFLRDMDDTLNPGN